MSIRTKTECFGKKSDGCDGTTPECFGKKDLSVSCTPQKLDMSDMFQKMGSKLGWFKYKDLDSAINKLSCSSEKISRKSKRRKEKESNAFSDRHQISDSMKSKLLLQSPLKGNNQQSGKSSDFTRKCRMKNLSLTDQIGKENLYHNPIFENCGSAKSTLLSPQLLKSKSCLMQSSKTYSRNGNISASSDSDDSDFGMPIQESTRIFSQGSVDMILDSPDESEIVRKSGKTTLKISSKQQNTKKSEKKRVSIGNFQKILFNGQDISDDNLYDKMNSLELSDYEDCIDNKPLKRNREELYTTAVNSDEISTENKLRSVDKSRTSIYFDARSELSSTSSGSEDTSPKRKLKNMSKSIIEYSTQQALQGQTQLSEGELSYEVVDISIQTDEIKISKGEQYSSVNQIKRKGSSDSSVHQHIECSDSSVHQHIGSPDSSVHQHTGSSDSSVHQHIGSPDSSVHQHKGSSGSSVYMDNLSRSKVSLHLRNQSSESQDTGYIGRLNRSSFTSEDNFSFNSSNSYVEVQDTATQASIVIESINNLETFSSNISDTGRHDFKENGGTEKLVESNLLDNNGRKKGSILAFGSIEKVSKQKTSVNFSSDEETIDDIVNGHLSSDKGELDNIVSCHLSSDEGDFHDIVSHRPSSNKRELDNIFSEYHSSDEGDFDNIVSGNLSSGDTDVLPVTLNTQDGAGDLFDVDSEEMKGTVNTVLDILSDTDEESFKDAEEYNSNLNWRKSKKYDSYSSGDEDQLEMFFKKMKTTLEKKNSFKKEVQDDLDSFIVEDSEVSSEDDDAFYTPTPVTHDLKVKRRIMDTIEILSSDTSCEELPDIPKSAPKKNQRKLLVVEDNKPPLKTGKMFEAEGRQIFLKSLSKSQSPELCDLDAMRYLKNFARTKDELILILFEIYNETVFENKLPADLLIVWNKRMLKTAGYCIYKRETKGDNRTVRIELSTKVCDCAERVRDTLLHELCHAAVWILNGVKEGHGPYWKYWARKTNVVHPEIPVVTRCHSYSIQTKYIYQCSQCKYQIGRHSKSLDTEKKVCGHCMGKFILLDNKRASCTTPKTPNKFAMFVKEHYKDVRNREKSMKHADVMSILSKEFAKQKI